MRVLVTAGSTNIPIDQVRVISNIFSGRTGTDIADYFACRGAEITILTSNRAIAAHCHETVNIIPYKTFDELETAMTDVFANNKFDVVIHSAAISDYRVAGVMVQQDGSLIDLDRSNKISSSHEEMFLRLTQTPKLVDNIRDPWGFKGLLVKFKLQVGMTDEELIDIATKSMHQSNADMIVANCLEWAKERAYIINKKDDIISTTRKSLAHELYTAVIGELS